MEDVLPLTSSIAALLACTGDGAEDISIGDLMPGASMSPSDSGLIIGWTPLNALLLLA